MPNQYYTINATFKDLLGWIDGYGRLFPPPSGQHLRYSRVGPEPTWPGNGVHWYAKVCAHSRWQPQTPIFEIGADEEDGNCRVRLTCLDRNCESWYRAMIDFLVPDDAAAAAATHAHPLPELPSLGPAQAPSPAAPAPVPAQPPQPAERDAPGPSPQTQPPAPKGRRSAGSNLGRPSFPDEYKKLQVEEYEKVRGIMTQKAFCRNKPYSERTLRSWQVWYREQYGEPHPAPSA